MSSVEPSEREVRISVRNVGGIDETDVELASGVNVLAGRNATNRTSLLQAIMAALGSDRVSLKGDADEGSVELTIGDETYTRTLHRSGGTVVADGDPLLDDPELADLFAFLLESNEARRAVARGDDLRELIMRPVDTEAIRTDIDRMEEEKRRLDDELDRLAGRKNELPELEQRREELERQLEEKRERLAEKQAEIEDADADVSETREEKAELEEKLDELKDTRSELEDVRFNLEAERESLSSLSDERDQLTAERDDLPDAPTGELEEVDDRIDRLRDRKRALDSTINQLQNVIQFNENVLEGDSLGLLDALHDGDDEHVTSQLLADGDDAVCWTCGSEVDKQQIESTLERLRDVRQETFAERNAVTDDLSELKDRRAELEQKQRRREQIRTTLANIEAEIDTREENAESFERERESLTDRITELESEVEQLEAQDYSAVLELHKEANQLEFELDRIQDDRESVQSKIAEIEEDVAEHDRLSERREEVKSTLDELRTRIEEIEQQAVEEFNEHMTNVLEMLGYENLERIWIDRTQRTVREGRRTVERSVFDLQITRTTDDGTVYQDTVDHLSESEREVTGLVFGLAGYLVHDVHEAVPFMVLDSLEAVDSGRIARLIEYFTDYAEHVVVALLPEDAAAVDDEYYRTREI